jgi:hypothetical protein
MRTRRNNNNRKIDVFRMSEEELIEFFEREIAKYFYQ